jgi:hypothetical protein
VHLFEVARSGARGRGGHGGGSWSESSVGAIRDMVVAEEDAAYHEEPQNGGDESKRSP